MPLPGGPSSLNTDVSVEEMVDGKECERRTCVGGAEYRTMVAVCVWVFLIRCKYIQKLTKSSSLPSARLEPAKLVCSVERDSVGKNRARKVALQFGVARHWQSVMLIVSRLPVEASHYVESCNRDSDLRHRCYCHTVYSTGAHLQEGMVYSVE